MNTPHPANRTPFWSARARKRAVAQEPADMGTCFGLEMTLDDSTVGAPPANTPPRHWWQRRARAKTATA